MRRLLVAASSAAFVAGSWILFAGCEQPPTILTAPGFTQTEPFVVKIRCGEGTTQWSAAYFTEGAWATSQRDAYLGSDSTIHLPPLSPSVSIGQLTVSCAKDDRTSKSESGSNLINISQEGMILPDDDGDRSPNINDCQPNNNAVSPFAPERCGNGVDDNCNGQIDEDGCF